jgi:hypothetical protein
MLGPFLVCDWPPLVDLPNHLARYHLIARAAAGAPSPFFVVDWSRAGTNLGGDGVALVLGPVLGPEGAARLLTWTCVIGPPLGALALSWRLNGALQPWQALIPIGAWTVTSLMGLVNFQLGLALALVFVVVDPSITRGRTDAPSAMLRAAAALVLALAHSFALIFYLGLLAALAWGPEARPPSWSAAKRSLIALLPGLIGLVAPIFAGRPLPGGGEAGFRFDRWPDKLLTLFTPLTSYALPLDALILLGLVLAIRVAARRGALRMHGGLGLLAIGLMAASLATPSHAFGASWLDRRLPSMALLAALAGAGWASASDRFAVRLAAMFTAIVAIKAALIGSAWRTDAALIAETRKALSLAPVGARVAPVQYNLLSADRMAVPLGRFVFGFGDPVFQHLAAWVVTDRHGFEPMIFAARGLQLLAVAPPWSESSNPNGGAVLDMAALTQTPGPDYLRNWRRDYDFILVFNRDQARGRSPPAGLTPVHAGRYVELLRVAPQP